MGRQNIYDLVSVSSLVPATSIQELLEFMIANRQAILPSNKRDEAFRSRFSGQSYMADIVHALTTKGKDSNYSLLKVPNKTTHLREVVDMTFLPFDVLQLKEAISFSSRALSLIPELDDKLVINVSDITRANGEFADLSQFQWRVVRDFLSRSYYMSTTNIWISPALVRYVAKVYSMTIGAELARMFLFGPVVRQFVQCIFCMFFVGKMTRTDLVQGFVRANARELDIRDHQELTQYFAFVEDILQKRAPETLEDVFKVVSAYNHGSLSGPAGSRLDRPVLNMKLSKLFSESQVSVIALEYPPYFTFLILLALSNFRIGLSIRMKEFNLVKEGRTVFDQLVHSSALIADI